MHARKIEVRGKEPALRCFNAIIQMLQKDIDDRQAIITTLASECGALELILEVFWP